MYVEIAKVLVGLMPQELVTDTLIRVFVYAVPTETLILFVVEFPDQPFGNDQLYDKAPGIVEIL